MFLSLLNLHTDNIVPQFLLLNMLLSEKNKLNWKKGIHRPV